MIKTIKDVDTLVTDYCNHVGLPEPYLHKQYGKTGKCKRYNGIRVDQMRMALAYYVRENSNLTVLNISNHVGYACHTTICQNQKRVKFYIESKDPVFYPYWEKLLEIAN